MPRQLPAPKLLHFHPLVFNTPGVSNEIDSAIAEIDNEVLINSGYYQRFHPDHQVAGIRGTAAVEPDEVVFKVGRTTGLTFGKVSLIGGEVKKIPYGPGDCRFSSTIVIQSLDPAKQFAACGDSGSVIVRASTGEVVGLLYAGSKVASYACPIDIVLKAHNCTLL